MAPFPPPSSSLAKSLEAAIAAAEREPHSYPFILPSDDEEATPIPPITPLPHDNKGKRKMSVHFVEVDDQTAPTENPVVSTELSLNVAGPSTFKHTKTALALSSATHLSDAQYDKGKEKMPALHNFFASNEAAPTETGVCTDLTLYFPGPPTKSTALVSPTYSPPTPRHVIVVVPVADDLPEDGWEIKKVLTSSDVNGSSRLLLPKVDVRKYILPHVIMGNGPGPEEGQEVEVAVRDVDTESDHVLVLTKWVSAESFVLKKNWMSEFVRRRVLKENDEIGLRWDDENSRLEFTVLLKMN